jgi:hypothetical protein
MPGACRRHAEHVGLPHLDYANDTNNSPRQQRHIPPRYIDLRHGTSIGNVRHGFTNVHVDVECPACCDTLYPVFPKTEDRKLMPTRMRGVIKDIALLSASRNGPQYRIKSRQLEAAWSPDPALSRFGLATTAG